MITDTKVQALFIGSVQNRWPNRPASAIEKHQTVVPLNLTETGFIGDVQADLRVHGGPEKAVHHYPADHYVDWCRELGERPTFRAGGFGENVATIGLTEGDVCIGDVFRLGTATVQISQGRQPCWKLSAHTGEERMAYLVQRTARTGWYYRVLEEGLVRRGDTLKHIERPQPDWTVLGVTQARFAPKLHSTTATALASLPELTDGWRTAFTRKAEGAIEDSSKRIDG